MATLDLMELQPQKINRSLKGKGLLIYGAPGVGKTTFAASFDKALIMGFELGYLALNNVTAVPIKTWKDWKDYVKQLVKNEALKDKFFTITIDTVEEAYKLCEKFICNKYGVESIKEVAGYGQGYAILDDEFITPFRDLAYAGYGIIFISHETDKVYKDDQGKEYSMIVPSLPKRPEALINKMVDMIGYIRNVSTFNDKNEIEQKRMLYFRGDDRFLAKSRFKYIEPKIELTYEAYLKALYDAIDKEIEVSGGEANDEMDLALEQSFDEMIEEAKTYWIKAQNNGSLSKIQEILKKEFGRSIKFSEIKPEQKEQLNDVLLEIRSII